MEADAERDAARWSRSSRGSRSSRPSPSSSYSDPQLDAPRVAGLGVQGAAEFNASYRTATASTTAASGPARGSRCRDRARPGRPGHPDRRSGSARHRGGSARARAPGHGRPGGALDVEAVDHVDIADRVAAQRRSDLGHDGADDPPCASSCCSPEGRGGSRRHAHRPVFA